MAGEDMSAMQAELVARRLDDVVREMRQLASDSMRRDVYEAQRQADTARVAAVEKELAGWATDRSSLRRIVLGTALTAGASTVVQLFVFFLTR